MVHRKSLVQLNLEYKRVNYFGFSTKFVISPLKQRKFSFIDLNDLALPRTCTTDFPDPDDLLTFKLIVCPDDGKKLIWLNFQQ